MSHPLQAVHRQGEEGKAPGAEAEVKDIKHRSLLMSDGATLEPGRVKALCRIGLGRVKDA
ncbi:hypothetical protein GCM10011341_04580 [Frigidibacter albus]|uniref:hypothetical protein n=1 Tax=Frigidibacter mobilis TaxID=1335048 RepID=UPI0014122841|nr:hypothetical protein [Frigidibacter mobilis]GGH44951.1 hypothetical protein GCM10011341_04580 [Frigidibacter albus]